LTLWNLSLRELMGVGGVLTVTLVAESEVITLLAVKAEMTFLDGLEALWLITYKPHGVSFILVALVCRCHNFLLELLT